MKKDLTRCKGMPGVILGLGCRPGIPVAALERALGEGLTRVGLGPEAVQGVATIDRRGEEAGIQDLCRGHAWPLWCYPAQVLARVPVPHPSAALRRRLGTGSVAAAAALLAAGAPVRDLLLERHVYRDGEGQVVVAVARLPDMGAG
ncbi:cobalt-precorrin 5A hydrolase/cobalt-precorrin 5A hydrolase / precorrin-3B C17-methyltransferase [Ectothiorhodospira mobilis]|uniref:Cobalt-precorrin 5A hydrolase/cobalt-precorrin 5A hydrolase / precorrin-3B C17-methyltransferase n=1 Tax=Ectothiorhodospira mobilis TaxID=195064 RepID=A0A1I4RXQ3_ECTMO|nr:cobalamin biosynthesis protein [Ectothiorhodospira mobilis]SFM56733.1 cobalt-precorrin 5A hydrolase/cobalt-precorrin 5A hydrolase / precorrin-3B C17-methyltransferase [Ectothiorhodospira mobilis]